RRLLPERMIPRSFAEIEVIPRRPDGRLDTEHPLLDAGTDEYVAPQTATEILLANVWGEALGVPRVSAHDNFFLLGGYSLLCFQVLARIESQTGHRLSPRLLLLD